MTEEDELDARIKSSVALNDESYTEKSSTLVSERIAEIGFIQSIELLSNIPLHSSTSAYQEIELYESKFYGKILVLDGVLQITEQDGSAYNEMLAHVPMMAHASPKRVLVIGGGDGYIVSEVLKHKEVDVVDHVDLDGEVVRVCEKYFKWGSVAWSDERVNLKIEDGAAFAKNAPDNYYDVVIQDSSDPFTANEDGVVSDLPSSVLYKPDHFANIKRILKDDGIFMLQSETYTIPSDLEGIKEWRQQALDLNFGRVRYGTLAISTYPTGQIGFLICEAEGKEKDDKTLLNEVTERFNEMQSKNESTEYYHPRLQIS